MYYVYIMYLLLLLTDRPKNSVGSSRTLRPHVRSSLLPGRQGRISDFWPHEILHRRRVFLHLHPPYGACASLPTRSKTLQKRALQRMVRSATLLRGSDNIAHANPDVLVIPVRYHHIRHVRPPVGAEEVHDDVCRRRDGVPGRRGHGPGDRFRVPGPEWVRCRPALRGAHVGPCRLRLRFRKANPWARILPNEAEFPQMRRRFLGPGRLRDGQGASRV